MFEGEWDELDAAATLDAAVEFDAAENHAALGKLRAALHFADLHADLPIPSQHAPTMPGGERLKVYGGDGCPAVAEFAPAEYAAVLGLSARTGASLMGEALALRHRFPRIWARTLAEETLVWRARAVARACLALSQEAAALADRRLVGKLDTLSTYRMYQLIDSVILQVDPDAARKAAEERARDRGVWVQRSDEHGTKTIFVKAAAGDVIRFDATICDLAWALSVLGDTDTLDQRRSKAIGWIADPAAAYELIAAARFLATQQRNGTTCNGTCDGSCTGNTSDAAAGDPASDTMRSADAGDKGGHDQGKQDENGWFVTAEEPGVDEEADRDTPHPSQGDHLDHLDKLSTGDLQRSMAGLAWRHPVADDYTVHGHGRDAEAFSRHGLDCRLAAIKHAAHAGGLGAGGGRGRPRNVLYAHITDEGLLSGDGIVRVEEHGALLVSQLRELLGHDQVILKAVIDLNDKISADAYEIPARIRERVKLMHPAERFPFGSAETTMRTDLDHVVPYDPNGPPRQTSTGNLSPLVRLHHRLKTHGHWRVEQLDDGALQWMSPNGFGFRVDHTGTHRLRSD